MFGKAMAVFAPVNRRWHWFYQALSYLCVTDAPPDSPCSDINASLSSGKAKSQKPAKCLVLDANSDPFAHIHTWNYSDAEDVAILTITAGCRHEGCRKCD